MYAPSVFRSLENPYTHTHTSGLKRWMFFDPVLNLHCHGNRCSGHSTSQNKNILTMSKVYLWICLTIYESTSSYIFAFSFFTVLTIPLYIVDNTQRFKCLYSYYSTLVVLFYVLGQFFFFHLALSKNLFSLFLEAEQNMD